MLRDFFEEEFVLALRADEEQTLTAASPISVHLLEAELAKARRAPRWYARVRSREVIVDWVFSEGRLEFSRRRSSSRRTRPTSRSSRPRSKRSSSGPSADAQLASSLATFHEVPAGVSMISIRIAFKSVRI